MNRPDSDNSRKTESKEVPLEFVEKIPGAAERGNTTQKESGEGRTGRKANVVRFVLSLLVAATADGLEVLFPPAWLPIDLATVALFLLLWGFRWEVALVLVPEIIPGANVFPSWILLALYLGNQNLKARSSG
jgi:hypothetical protein